MIKKITIILCFTIISFSAFSQKKWSLRDCIDYAVENNIDIKRQALDVQKSEVELNTSKSSRLPNLNGEIGQAFSFGRPPVETGISESLNLSHTSFSLSSSLPIFTGFRIPNEIKRDEFNLKASMENLSKAKENMELHITSLYLRCLMDREMIKICEETLKLTEKQVNRTKALVRSGAVSESQLYDINSQLAKDELNLTSAENSLTLSLLYLTQALNLHDAEGFDIQEPSIDDKTIKANMLNLAVSTDDIYDMALGIKPHIKEAEYTLDKSKAEIEIAKSYYYPTVSLGVSLSSFYNYIYNKNNLNSIFFADLQAGADVQIAESYYWPAMEFGVNARALANFVYNTQFDTNFFRQFRRNSNELIGLNVSIPIFNRNKTKNQVKLAKINMTEKMFALDNIKLALYKEIQEAHTSAVSSKSQYLASEKALKAAQEAYHYAVRRYDVGNSTVFELNEAQTRLFASKSEQLQAKYDFLFRTKILDFYKGIKIEIY